MNAGGALARRIAESRKGQHGDARFDPDAFRDARGLDGYFREIGRLRHFGDRRVGDDHDTAAGEHQRCADKPVAGLLVDDTPDILQRVGEIARDAGHHGVGVALRDHRGGEMIAVGVDEPLAIAEQKAPALQTFEQKLRINRVAR